MKSTRKIILLMLMVLAVAGLCVFVAACGEEPVSELTGITVSGEYKTEYVEGQTFDDEGMVVTANYDDGTSKTVTDYTIDKTGALKTSDNKITVSYEGKTAEVEITVAAKAVTGITLDTSGVTKNYFVGDTFSSNGLKVTAEYNDGTSASVTTGFTVSKPDMSSAGSKEVTVTYQNKTAKYNITVTAVVLESIEVTKQPTKTTYIEGQTFDKAGMEVTAHYNDARKDKVITDYTVDKTTLATSDTKVTVSYQGKTAEVVVTVNAKSVTEITLNTDSVKKDYYVGDGFESKGLEVVVRYDNGDSETITEGFEIVAPDMMSAGNKTVTVKYGGQTATYEINVQAVVLTKLEITTEPKTTYVAGDTFDPSGMVVKATYNTGSVDEDFTDYDYDKKDALTTEDKYVTVSAGDVSVQLAITVLKAELSDIEVKADGITKKDTE